MAITGTLTTQATTITGSITVGSTTVSGTISPVATTISGTLNISAGPAGPGLPPGGAVGQIVVKSTANDYDTEWADPDQASVPIEVTQHIARTDNPHNVTESQIPDGIDYTLLFENALI